jgi:hypothetical protein
MAVITLFKQVENYIWLTHNVGMSSSTIWLIVISGSVVLIIAISIIAGSLTGRVRLKDSSTMSSVFNVDRVNLVLCKDCAYLSKQEMKPKGCVYFCKKGLAKPAKSSTISSTVYRKDDRYPCNSSLNKRHQQ